MATYPATNTNEASELLVDVSNQMHQIVNEDAVTEVTTESGPVPSVRKALADTFLFVEPVAWDSGNNETAFNQLRTFGDETYWAPTATLTNPIAMGATPVGDNNWRLAPTGKNSSIVQGWDTAAQQELINGKIYPEIGTLSNGDTVPLGTTHLRVLVDGEAAIVEMTEQASGAVTALSDTLATIGGVSVGLMRTDGSVFCVIRQSSPSSGWDYIVDNGHAAKGFSQAITVDEVTRNLIIPVDGVRSKVGAISVTPDETFAKKITVGTSALANQLTLKIFAPLAIDLNTDTLLFSVSDFQDAGDISVSKTDGVLTITHPSNAIITSLDDRSVISVNGNQYIISSRLATQTVIEEVRPWCCNVKWDGSQWVVTSNLKTEPSIIAAGGAFIVSHSIGGFNLPQASMNLANGYQVVIDNSDGGNSFYVRFRDGAGNAISTPDTNMNVNLSMPLSVKQNTITGRLIANIGMVQVHPDNIYGNNSNFWIEGHIR